MTGGPAPGIVAIELTDRKAKQRFVECPYSIYRDDPDWIAPLLLDSLERLDVRRHPYHAHSTVQPFLAIRDGEVVGRIAAHENTRYPGSAVERVGFFGLFESIDDTAVSDALFNAAAEWLSSRGVTTMRGPAGFSERGDPVGLLVSGESEPAAVGMAYNPRYYERLFDAASLVKAEDLYAYYFPISDHVPERVRTVAERALCDPRLVIRRLDMRRFREELDRLRFLYDGAYSTRRGGVPMSDEEYGYLVRELRLAVDRRVSFIAEYDGEPVGVSLMLIDLPRAMRPAKGRLIPFGLLRMLARKQEVDRVRLALLFALEPFRLKGIDAVFYYRSLVEGAKLGYRHGEFSWVAESNEMTRKILEHMELKRYKTYRIYERKIG